MLEVGLEQEAGQNKTDFCLGPRGQNGQQQQTSTMSEVLHASLGLVCPAPKTKLFKGDGH